MTAPVTCEHCDEVIGVYEPMVVLVDGKPRETSQAADPDAVGIPGAHYFHVACYAGTAD